MRIVTSKQQDVIYENAIKLDMYIRKCKETGYYYEMIEALDNILEECLNKDQLDRMIDYLCEVEDFEIK